MRKTCSTKRSKASRSQKFGGCSNQRSTFIEIFDSEHSDIEDRFIAIFKRKREVRSLAGSPSALSTP
jgi:hypothetical protein